MIDQLLPHSHGDFVLGAFDDANLLIGTVGFFRTSHVKSSHKGTLWGMYVTPTKRQQGIGSALVTAAIRHATTVLGVVNINLCVTTSNKAARKLYTSQGFQLIGIERKAIKIDNVYFDEALMQLVL